MSEGEWVVHAFSFGISKSQESATQEIQSMVSQQCCMGTDGSYTCGEHSIMYKLVKSLSCTPETNVTLCVNYTQIKRENTWCLDIQLDYQMNGSPINYGEEEQRRSRFNGDGRKSSLPFGWGRLNLSYLVDIQKALSSGYMII